MRAAGSQEASTIATKEPHKIRRSGAQASQPAPAPANKGKTKKTKVKGRHPILSFIGHFIAICICLGMMGGAAAAVWVCSYVTEATADDAVLLNLDDIEFSQTSVVYAQHYDENGEGMGDWQQVAEFRDADSHRLYVSLENISEDLQWAFICTEDKDFYTEPGVNFKRTLAAAINEYTPVKLFSSRQGASTIEQQLIKNLLDDDDQSGFEGVKRKLREIYRALGISNQYSKETILEAYLNTISFTGTIQGVEAAAQEYFGKSSSELSLAECAVIASITKNPTQYNPYTNPEALLERRHLVLWNMLDQGKITQAEYDEADASPLVLVEGQSSSTQTTTDVNSYFIDALFNAATEEIMEKEGLSKVAAQKLIYTGGLQFYATMDPDIQAAAEQIMLNTDDTYFPAGWREEDVSVLSEDDTPIYNEDGSLKTTTAEDGSTVYYRSVRTQASMVSMDYNGNVLAIVGGLGEKTTNLSLNRATDAPRQTGSTIKPIGPYAQGIESGLFHWSSMLNDSPLYTAADMVIRDDDYCSAHGLSGLSDVALQAYPAAWRDWPANYGKQYDYTDWPLWNGLAQSRNTIAARIGEVVGADAIYEFLTQQLQFSHLVEQDNALAPMTMGSQSYGVTTLELCAAYQIFYNGVYTTPHFYTEVYDSAGNLYMEADTTSYQALTEETATIMNRLMRNVLVSGTAGGHTPKAGGMEAVGKTGTASDWRDFSFVGLTPYYVTAVWWGYDSPAKMKSLGSTRNCILAWKALMEAVQGDLVTQAFPMSDGVVRRAYCVDTGLLANATCPNQATGYYNAEYLADGYPGYCDAH